VKTWFRAFAFDKCNLCRYFKSLVETLLSDFLGEVGIAPEAGLFTPGCHIRWFWVSSFEACAGCPSPPGYHSICYTEHAGCHQLNVFWVSLPGVRLVTCTKLAAV
jgi:hypothetical protein